MPWPNVRQRGRVGWLSGRIRVGASGGRDLHPTECALCRRYLAQGRHDTSSWEESVIGRARQAGDKPREVLDGEAWRVAVALILAASRADRKGFLTVLTKRVAPMSNTRSRWLYVYLRYVLKWRLLDDFPHDTADLALLDFAEMLRPEVERLVHLPPDVLDNCLLSAFDKVDPDAVKPGEVIVAASAVIGLLMKDEAKSELKTVRPQLAEYLERWEGEIRRDIGLSGPAGAPSP
jgi:hypothetical protein